MSNPRAEVVHVAVVAVWRGRPVILRVDMAVVARVLV